MQTTIEKIELIGHSKMYIIRKRAQKDKKHKHFIFHGYIIETRNIIDKCKNLMRHA